MARQDEGLEMLAQSANRLGEMSSNVRTCLSKYQFDSVVVAFYNHLIPHSVHNISSFNYSQITEELDYQNNMLNEMEDDLDTATDNLDMVTRKTRELITKAGGKQNFMIILSLIGVVLFLLFLILYG